jgi:hypothetical protein
MLRMFRKREPQAPARASANATPKVLAEGGKP